MKKILLLSTSLLACNMSWQKNDTHEYHLYISPDFSADQANMIVQAATEWQTSMGNYIRFDGAGVENGNDTINIYPSTLSGLSWGKGCLGETWTYGVNQKIEIATDSNDFYQTTLHEFGHAIGANHIASGNIMCADRGCASQHVECGDLIEVCSHWGFSCNAESMPACK